MHAWIPFRNGCVQSWAAGRTGFKSWKHTGHSTKPRRPSSMSMKRRSAPKEKCPWYFSLLGPLGDTPSIRNTMFVGPCKVPKGTNTKVTSAKGPFCAYPTIYGYDRTSRSSGCALAQTQAPCTFASALADCAMSLPVNKEMTGCSERGCRTRGTVNMSHTLNVTKPISDT